MFLVRILLVLNGIIYLASVCLAGRVKPGGSQLLRRMNQDADPCDDFYEYACGGFVNNTVLPGDAVWEAPWANIRLTEHRIRNLLAKPVRRSDIEAVRKAKKLFRSCMCVEQIEAESIESALEFLTTSENIWPYLSSSGGSWPTFDETWTDAQFDLESSLAAASNIDHNDLSEQSLGSIVPLTIFPDYEEPFPNNAIQFFRPRFHVPDDLLTPEIEDAMEELIYDTLVLLGADSATARTDAQAMVDFELILQDISRGGLHTLSIDTANILYPTIDWSKYINKVLADVGTTVDGDTDIYLIDETYYTELDSLLESESNRTIANVIKWRMFTTLVPAMPESIRERFRQFENLRTGIEELPSRWKHCVRVVTGSYLNALPTVYGMSLAVSRMFVDKCMPPAIKEQTAAIGEEIKDVLEEGIGSSTWLSEETKDTLKEKLAVQIEEYVAPENLYSDDYLNNYYRDFDIRDRRFFENFVSTVIGNTRRRHEQLENQDHNEWLLPPSVSHHFNSLDDVLIALTAALLQPKGSVFDLRYPSAFNYAGAGFFMARVTGLTIGLPGFIFNKDGVIADTIYSAASLPNLVLIQGCLVSQYGAYTWPFTDDIPREIVFHRPSVEKMTSPTKIMYEGFFIKPYNKIKKGITFKFGHQTAIYGPIFISYASSQISSLTIFHNFGDNVGLKYAYLAYNKLSESEESRPVQNLPFTAKELFFIDYAQNFCEVMRPEFATEEAYTSQFSPGKYRVIVPLQNFPEFAEVFNCPADSFMNPAVRCSTFGD